MKSDIWFKSCPIWVYLFVGFKPIIIKYRIPHGYFYHEITFFKLQFGKIYTDPMIISPYQLTFNCSNHQPYSFLIYISAVRNIIVSI